MGYHTFSIAAGQDPTLALTIYTAEPGTDSADRLKLLASLAATGQPARARTDQAH